MKEEISIEKKQSFLKWLTNNYQFKVRESLWILDYLYNHETMLGKSHFVEKVDQTPRGIYLSDIRMDQKDFIFYKKGHSFEDPVQAFHEIRLNWSSHLYLEIDFKGAWQAKEYLAVLEDNPYAPWNDDISEELVREMAETLRYETMIQNEKKILIAIDETLKFENKFEFIKLSKELKSLKKKINEFILEE
ncbi:MAG: YpiB family protein [Atopostipes suicloacalis]|nr:YpiB family protein [Atopostipes suicloacalis]